jgi:hypothetical protein
VRRGARDAAAAAKEANTVSGGVRSQGRWDKRPRPERVRSGRPPRGSSRASEPSVSLVTLIRPRPANRSAAPLQCIRALIVLVNVGAVTYRSAGVGALGAIATSPVTWVILVLAAGPIARGVARRTPGLRSLPARPAYRPGQHVAAAAVPHRIQEAAVTTPPGRSPGGDVVNRSISAANPPR